MINLPHILMNAKRKRYVSVLNAVARIHGEAMFAPVAVRGLPKQDPPGQLFGCCCSNPITLVQPVADAQSYVRFPVALCPIIIYRPSFFQNPKVSTTADHHRHREQSPHTQEWKDGRGRESLASATSTAASVTYLITSLQLCSLAAESEWMVVCENRSPQQPPRVQPRYMENSFYSAMEIGDEVGCQRNARIARASGVEIHNAIDAWIVGMLLISDVVCKYQIVRMESKNVLVLGVEKKMYVIEQPILPAHAADFAANMLAEWNAVYDAYNEVACLMLGKKGKPVAAYVLKMKGYVEQLERLGYVLPQDLSVGLILNGLTIDFAGFLRNYNMHNMEKRIGQGKDKQVYIPKPKNPKPSANEHLAKDDTFHHCKDVGHWKTNCPVYLAELLKKRCMFGSACSLGEVFTGPFLADLGYPKETMGYYFYFLPENKIVVARYAEFFKKSLITQEVSGRAIDLEEIQDEDTSPSKITSEIPMKVKGFEPPQEEVIPIRRSERTHGAPTCLCLNVEAEEHSLGGLNEPTSCKAAMLDPESNKWLDAMNAEIQSMIDNMVWVLVDLPPNFKTVGSKWIYKKKSVMNGIVHTYKARLVAKGYTQLYGVDYKETFSPVADIRAIRILISIAAFYDYEIWKIDVKTAFLNGYLDEDIYMVQTEGFVDPKHPYKASGSNVTFLILYVDDIIIMGNHIPSLQSVKDYLGKCFAMKDLGEAAFILGIKIYRYRSKRLIRLSQSAYTDKILKRYKIDNSKRGHIPMQKRLDLNKTQVRCTRPDVAFSQIITSHFQQNSGEPHWTAVKNILKYLRNTKDMFSVYGGNSKAELRVDCYCAVDWKSSKQSTTAMSATEAEYIPASEAAMEAV
ncbi:retrotransposon protein, putative, ty1-copia subclass [Tanacetum coccineum]